MLPRRLHWSREIFRCCRLGSERRTREGGRLRSRKANRNIGVNFLGQRNDEDSVPL